MTQRKRVVVSLAALSAVSLVMWLVGVVAVHGWQFTYLLWNLFLAWTPLLVTALLVKLLRSRAWSSWLPFCVSVLWILLLPNSFYMISDFIHLGSVAPAHILFDVVLFTVIITTGVLLGFASLSMINDELDKRLPRDIVGPAIGVVILVCSFAIYLGRDLRWNSWDVLLNPAGILFDVSDHLLHPFQHGAMFTTTLSFFVLLGSLYAIGRIWYNRD